MRGVFYKRQNVFVAAAIFYRRADDFYYRLVAVKRIASAAKNHRVARFKTQRESVRRNVGAGLEDYADNPERNGDFFYENALLLVFVRIHGFAERVFKFRYLLHTLRHTAENFIRNGKPVYKACAFAVVFCNFHVLGVFGFYKLRVIAKSLCRAAEYFVLFSFRIIQKVFCRRFRLPANVIEIKHFAPFC